MSTLYIYIYLTLLLYFFRTGLKHTLGSLKRAYDALGDTVPKLEKTEFTAALAVLTSNNLLSSAAGSLALSDAHPSEIVDAGLARSEKLIVQLFERRFPMSSNDLL